jgi:hypothetical protein
MDEDAKDKEFRFASTANIDRYEHLFRDFFIDVLDMDYDEDAVFVSDLSSLSDFTTHGQGPKSDKAEIALWQTRIEETYGVNVSDIEGGNLVEIFERIAAASD